MGFRPRVPVTGLLFSGGLDSALLLELLTSSGQVVQPIYVRGNLRWEADELAAARRYLATIAQAAVRSLIVLDSPLATLYGNHWSAGNAPVPNSASPDSEVYLPGRNLMLVAPAALWCQLNGITPLAIGVLGNNPFADATPEYFAQLEAILQQSHAAPLALQQPLREVAKPAALQAATHLPLQLTFSCLAPQQGIHCGGCNKCAERQRAFQMSGTHDPTEYVAAPVLLV